MKQRTKSRNKTHQDKAHRPRRRLLSVLVAQAMTLPAAAQAANVQVTSTADGGTGCTLREAVETINAGVDLSNGCSYSGSLGASDEVTFGPSVAGNTITLTNGEIPINASVAVNPEGAETTIDGNGSSRIFNSSSPGIEVGLDRLVLTGGDVAGAGGAIRVKESTVSLTNSEVSGNTAVTDGGGILAYQSASVTLTNSTVSGNTANSNSGGIDARFSSTVRLTDSTVLGNTAQDNSGGISARFSSTAVLMNSMVSGNTTDADGGGIFAEDSGVILTNSTVSGNTVGEASGGLFADDSTVTLTNSTVSDNSAALSGGGIFAVESSTVTLGNSTVSGNNASGGFGGGGIFAADSAVNLTNSTMSDNAATVGGGVIAFSSSSVTLMNSIVANSQGGGQDCAQDSSMVTAMGDSIIETDDCGTDAMNGAPGLLPLAANGGPTETHALMPGSPAIDAGDQTACATIPTDQRGFPRDDGHCDIGAYEFETMTPIAISPQDRAMGAVMNGADRWYIFDSATTQRVSIQTNGFGDHTRIELYTGADPNQATNPLADDDDSGPEQFSNIRRRVGAGNHLIRVIGNPAADPFFLRLMSAEDILDFTDTGGHFAATAIRVMSAAGITGGCGQGMYCPDDPVTRAQMALFMLRAIQGGNQGSPPATGNVFGDVGPNSFGANAIEEFSTQGITAGCGGGNYCPDDPVTREQMAIFLLRALFGAGHTPPQATQAEINQFSDISDSFARDWIVQLVDEGITGGCGNNQFCPTDPVTRGQMAAFIQRTFDLDTEL